MLFLFGSRTSSRGWTTVVYNNLFCPGCSSFPASAFGFETGWRMCLDSERGTLTCLVLVPQRLAAQCMPAIISIQFLSCDSSPTPADIALTVQFSQVKCPHLEQLVLEASALHSQQRKVISISLFVLENALGNVEKWSADVGV
jgi:hypothetical protein